MLETPSTAFFRPETELLLAFWASDQEVSCDAARRLELSFVSVMMEEVFGGVLGELEDGGVGEGIEIVPWRVR